MTPSPTGLRVQALRNQAGISGRELARLAGISPGYPAHIESGRITQIGSDIAASICRVLGCSLEYLLLGSGTPPSEEATRAAVAAAEAARPSTPATGTEGG